MRRLAATIEAQFGAVRSPADADLDRASEDRLHFDIAAAVLASGVDASSRDLLHVEHRRRLMQRAEEYLRANLAQPFDLGAFADAVGVSHRMLEYHFRRTYGVPPLAWHRSMRLDAARSDLRLARRRGEGVTAIALRWGFTHFGRFAEEYRRLFGERPVDTLRGA
jgi:AraC family ethanolamine operon transcriptional activator